MKTIFIIDDDVDIGNMIEELLVRDGYSVVRAYSGTEALLLLQSKTPDLILLDLMLPGLSGEEVLKKIKAIPVIILSAKVDIDNKVNLLLDGAVDYITKPFDTKELMARITVALRKTNEKSNNGVLECNGVKVDMMSHEVTVCEKEVLLTKTEFAILKILMINCGKVVSKSAILDDISLDTPDCTERSLKQHISNLRKKLSPSAEKEYIDSVWGIGFKFNE